MRARLLVASLRQVELPIAAAALAAALTHDAIAARTIETARAELPADVEELAAAFASQPARAEGRAARQGAPRAQEAAQGAPRRRGRRPPRATATQPKLSAQRSSRRRTQRQDAPSTAADGSPARKRRRRRRRRKGPGEGGGSRPRVRTGPGAPPARLRRRRPPAAGTGRVAGQRRALPKPQAAPAPPPLARRDGCRLDRPPAQVRGGLSVAATGHHPGRRVGHAALSGDARRLQAAAAGLRQADDLLPAEHADARGHPRDPRDHDAARRARASSSCSATAPPGASSSPTPQQPSPDGLAQALADRARLPRPARRPASCSATTSSTATASPTMLRAASAREHGATVFGYWVRDPERYGVVEFDARRARDRPRGEARAAEVELRRHRPLLLRRQRPGRRRGAHALAARRARDHRPQPPLPGARRADGRAARARLRLARHRHARVAACRPRTSSRRSRSARASRSRAPRRSPTSRAGSIATELLALAEPLRKNGYGEYLLALADGAFAGTD